MTQPNPQPADWVKCSDSLPREFDWCWVVWKGVVQEQPWEYVERTGVNGRRWWHDDMNVTVAGGVSHYMLCVVPSPPGGSEP